MPLADRDERGVLRGQIGGALHAAQRAVGQEREAELLAQVQLGLGVEVARVEPVLHGHQRVAEDVARLPDLRGLALEMPTRWTIPSSTRSLKAPIVSAYG